jgi:hypothetical protein
MTDTRYSRNRIAPADSVLVADFLSGGSVLAVARKHGCARATVKQALLRACVAPRTGSQANSNRFATATAAERKAITGAANAAVRGTKKAEAHKLCIAATRARTLGVRLGKGEQELLAALADFAPIPQFQIGPYNVDLLVGAVAVEVRQDTSRASLRPGGSERLEYIRDRGYPLLYVQFRHVEAMVLCLDHIIADINTLGRLPSGRGEYRMVWCGLHRFSRVRNDRGQITAVPTVVSATYVTRESDLCIPR